MKQSTSPQKIILNKESGKSTPLHNQTLSKRPLLKLEEAEEEGQDHSQSQHQAAVRGTRHTCPAPTACLVGLPSRSLFMPARTSEKIWQTGPPSLLLNLDRIRRDQPRAQLAIGFQPQFQVHSGRCKPMGRKASSLLAICRIPNMRVTSRGHIPNVHHTKHLPQCNAILFRTLQSHLQLTSAWASFLL